MQKACGTLSKYSNVAAFENGRIFPSPLTNIHLRYIACSTILKM